MTIELPACGEVFESRYVLESIVGEGGFGRVYRATDQQLGRIVAIKVMLPRKDGERGAARFLREARHVASLNHPNVVTMFDSGRTSAGLLYAVYEFVAGHNLTDMMDRPIPEPTVIRLLVQVLDALGAAHKMGLLHRDLKPDNIRIFEYMGNPHCVKLLDFGIAKDFEGGDADALTEAGQVLGTPRYMSPEGLFNDTLGPGSDIYAAGLVAWEMLVGEPTDHAKKMLTADRLSLPEDCDASADLRAVIEKMLMLQSRERFDDAHAVAARLREIERHSEAARRPPAASRSVAQAEPARHPPTEVRTPEPAPRVRNRVWAGVALLVSVLGVVALIFTRSQNTEPPPGPKSDRSRAAGLLEAKAPVAAPKSDHPPEVVDADLGVGINVETGCGAVAPPTAGPQTWSARRLLDEVSWGVHIPVGYNPETRYPLVMLFHDDGNATPMETLDLTKLGELADEHGFIIALPSDVALGYPWTDRADDERTRVVLEEMRRGTCLDEERIFAVGYSAGGLGADRVICDDAFDGVAYVSFIPEARRFECEPARPIPALVVLPTETELMPEAGGPDCFNAHKLAFAQYDDMWKERNRVSGKAEFRERHGRDVCQQWSGDAPYVSCRVAAGRRWRGAPSKLIDQVRCDGPATNFPHNEVIWGFFDGLGDRGQRGEAL